MKQAWMNWSNDQGVSIHSSRFFLRSSGKPQLQRSFTDADRIISLPGGTTVNNQDNRKRSFKRLVGWFLVSNYSSNKMMPSNRHFHPGVFGSSLTQNNCALQMIK